MSLLEAAQRAAPRSQETDRTPMIKFFKRLLLGLAALCVLAALLLAGAGLWFRQAMRGSLPQLDGTASLPGLSAPVNIVRDAQGVPSLTGTNRNDIARALGYLHAQDRFFQMDLLRRRSAGELAELFEAAALPIDKSARLHGFRRTAARIVSTLPAADRAMLDAYTAGVNAGLDSLAQKALGIPRAPPRAGGLAPGGFAALHLFHVVRPAGLERRL